MAKRWCLRILFCAYKLWLNQTLKIFSFFCCSNLRTFFYFQPNLSYFTLISSHFSAFLSIFSVFDKRFFLMSVEYTGMEIHLFSCAISVVRWSPQRFYSSAWQHFITQLIFDFLLIHRFSPKLLLEKKYQHTHLSPQDPCMACLMMPLYTATLINSTRLILPHFRCGSR